jgi:hypothetical protein
MRLRELLREKPWIGWSFAVVVIVAAVAVLVLRGRGGRADKVYFQELGSEGLFVASGSQVPPITGPTGKPSARARVFACGDCSREPRFTAYWESNTPDGKRARERMSRGAPAAEPVAPRRGARPEPGRRTIDAGRILALPSNPPEWVASTSDEAQPILNAAGERCGGKAVECLPE